MKTPRPRRTTLAGAHAQFAGLDAEAVNVSANGALIRAPKQRAPGSEWPLTLEINGTPVQLVARVVRCEPVAGPLETTSGKFELALIFVKPSAVAAEQLELACRSLRPVEDERRLRVSMTRRCPACTSRDVVKESKHSYSCHQCGRVFTGFRIAFLRFSK